MTERGTWHEMSDDELGVALADLGEHVEFPLPDRDLGPAIQARLGVRPLPRQKSWPRPLLAAAAVLVLASAAAVASPDARDAVADWLGLPGAKISYEDRIGASTAGAGLDLGEKVSLSQARRQAAFDLLLLPDELGRPDVIHYSHAVAGGRVSFVYEADDDLPASTHSGVGLLLTEFEAGLGTAAIEKHVQSGGQLDEVTVSGGRAYWFEGEPHQVYFLDRRGQTFFDGNRLAGNTLLWQRGRVVLRLEGQLSRSAMIELAESVGREE